MTSLVFVVYSGLPSTLHSKESAEKKVNLITNHFQLKCKTFLLDISCIKDKGPLLEFTLRTAHSHGTKMKQRKHKKDPDAKGRLNLE